MRTVENDQLVQTLMDDAHVPPPAGLPWLLGEVTGT